MPRVIDVPVAAFITAILIFAAGPALAQKKPAEARSAYPTKPIRFVVPFTPGGSQDIIARLIGQKLAERLGQQVVIDNRSGAAGLIAADLTAKATPDGHTIFMATAGPVTIAPSLHRKLTYDPMKELTAVIQLVETPMALIASNALPAKSVAEMLAIAKAKPGQLNYASVGNGSISHLAMELFKTETGINLVHIPYKGASPAFIDLVAGQVLLMFITTASAQAYTSAGKAKALAVAAKMRSTMMPDVPTMSEAGVKNFEVPVWAGAMTTAGTPMTAIEKLYREMRAVLQQPDIQSRLAQLGSDVVGSPPQEFAALLKADLARWAKVIKTANIKID